MSGRRVEIIEETVRVQRVGVEEQKPSGANPRGELEGVADAGVTPADVLAVLLVRVLAVVDEEVGVQGEVVTGDPLRLDLGENGAERRLVVGDVAQRLIALRDPEPERGATMVDRLAADRRRSERPLGRRGLAEGDGAGELSDLHR